MTWLRVMHGARTHFYSSQSLVTWASSELGRFPASDSWELTYPSTISSAVIIMILIITFLLNLKLPASCSSPAGSILCSLSCSWIIFIWWWWWLWCTGNSVFRLLQTFTMRSYKTETISVYNRSVSFIMTRIGLQLMFSFPQFPGIAGLSSVKCNKIKIQI